MRNEHPQRPTPASPWVSHICVCIQFSFSKSNLRPSTGLLQDLNQSLIVLKVTAPSGTGVIFLFRRNDNLFSLKCKDFSCVCQYPDVFPSKHVIQTICVLIWILQRHEHPFSHSYLSSEILFICSKASLINLSVYTSLKIVAGCCSVFC